MTWADDRETCCMTLQRRLKPGSVENALLLSIWTSLTDTEERLEILEKQWEIRLHSRCGVSLEDTP